MTEIYKFKPEYKMNNTVDSSRDRRVFFRSRDLFVVLALAIVSLAFFIATKTHQPVGNNAKIYFDGKLVKIIELAGNVEKEYRFTENPAIVIRQFSDNTIAFVSSDCPDRVCLRSGKIGRPGEFAACVPNRFLIVIEAIEESSESEDVDLVA